MHWFFNHFTPTNLCSYLIRNYCGPFFKEKLTNEQLNVELLRGKGSVEKISLDVDVLNGLYEPYNLPVELVEGYIHKLQIEVPWISLISKAYCIEVDRLELTFRPKQQNKNDDSMTESMLNSMTDSFKMNEESSSHYDESSFEGLENFANTIDSVICNVKMKFRNTVIKLENVPENGLTGVGIAINIDLIEFSDETKSDPQKEEVPEGESDNTNKANVVQTFTTKNLNIEGISISTLEFPSKARTFSRSGMRESQHEECESSGDEEETRTISPEPSSIGQSSDGQHSCDILFAKLHDQQLIKIYSKQLEGVSSSIVSLDINLGHIVLFLSPRQIHILKELVASIDFEDPSESQKRVYKGRPITAEDFERLEELQQHMQLSSLRTAGLQAMHTWSGLPSETSYVENQFYPMQNSSNNEMFESAMSGYTGSSLTSSVSSTVPSTVFTERTASTRRRSGGSRIDVDPGSETSHFGLKIASIALRVLHEDLLTFGPDEMTFEPSSVVEMRQAAVDFFELTDVDYSNPRDSNFERISETLNEYCPRNHISLYALPIHVQVTTDSTSTTSIITANIDIPRCQIQECLTANGYDFEVIPILKFDKRKSSTPDLHVRLKYKKKVNGSRRKKISTKTDLSFQLQKCSMELDVTIVDRLAALLHTQPVCVIESKNKIIDSWAEDISIDISNREVSNKIKIKSPFIELKLRFPIPDFRPSRLIDKNPLWKRHIRQDYLVMKLNRADFETSTHSSQKNYEYSLHCRGIGVFYEENDKGYPQQIAIVGSDEVCQFQETTEDVRIKINIFPLSAQMDVKESDDIMAQSMFCPSFLMETDSGPFTSKKVVHESNTPHDKEKREEEEELLIPGNKEEIEEFMSSTSESSRKIIDITIPSVKLQLLSKYQYEMIYNRINDILLWEPATPETKLKSSKYDKIPYMVPEKELFHPCRSGVEYGSDSDSDGCSERESVAFHSTYEKFKSDISGPPVSRQLVKQSDLIIKLNIVKGTVRCNTPVKDSSTYNVLPGFVGDLLLQAENATIFLVSGYKGDPDLAYFCLQVEQVALYHCEMVAAPSGNVRFPRDDQIEHHLHPTVYKSEAGTLKDIQMGSTVRDMLSLACKIQSKHETHHVKTVQIALGLNQGTLRYRKCIEPNSWLSQLLDFFNVNDYPISGYEAKEVLTEFYINMWDCAIDYRPRYLPLRSVITLGSFSISSHLTEKSDTTTLRFIAEECGLFISDKAPPKGGVPSSTPVNIRKDYVNVISLGLFEISLRTSDKNSLTQPHIDLRISNDCVHVYTCSDSGSALIQLITYIASDGDLKWNESALIADPLYTRDVDEEELVKVGHNQGQAIIKITPSQHEQVKELIAEAIEDEPVRKSVAIDEDDQGAQLFFFPDENKVIYSETTNRTYPQVTRELGDIRSQSHYESDDDFCIVDEVTALGCFPKNGVPEIKWLCRDPIIILENHFFAPRERRDILQKPDHYPIPKYKYTLCEMNIIWHMFGGYDFKSTMCRKKEKGEKVKSCHKLENKVRISSDDCASYIEHSSAAKQERRRKLSWKFRGGVNRDLSVLMELELNKVKFTHETYPKSTFHASRQVFVVTELEIRDLLASSEFNKFLYQYTSEARPKQSQGHMIVVKAVNIRPDKQLPIEECCLYLSLLPLRLNIDQDSLQFLISFFSELGQEPLEDSEMPSSSSKHNTPTHQPPILTVNTEEKDEKKVEKVVTHNENLMSLEENQYSVDAELNMQLDHYEEKPKMDRDSCSVDEQPESEEEVSIGANQPVFFRSVIFEPEVQIKIDYRGKHVDIVDGSLTSLLTGLIMGLCQLNCSELKLIAVRYRRGLLGFEKLLTFLRNEWWKDIKDNQIRQIISSVGPMHSIVELLHGIRDLFWMPLEQYKKDGRLVRGIQRGAHSFSRYTGSAVFELTSRFFELIRLTAEIAYAMLSPNINSPRAIEYKGQKKKRHQPQTVGAGLNSAGEIMAKGLAETAETIMKAASVDYDQKGYSGAVTGVVKQLPSTIIRPIIFTSEATNTLIAGIRCHYIPDVRNEANQKWRNNYEE